MKIKITVGLAMSEGRSPGPGDVIDVDADEGKALIAAGHAEALDGSTTPRKTPAKKRTARTPAAAKPAAAKSQTMQSPAKTAAATAENKDGATR